MSSATRTSVVVVGGGVSGLVAAHALGRHDLIDVTLLEASERFGGQIRTVDFDGARVDVGAEAAHLGAPHVAALVRELGLADSVIGAAAGSSVLVTRKGAVPLPAGVGPTGPTQLLPVLRSGILSLRGTIRAGLEPVMALRKVPGDIGVGQFTRLRFGDEVTDTFVDPLLGNLHGGDVHHLSLQATAAQLAPTAREGRSMLLKNLRPKASLPGRAKQPTGPAGPSLPAFASWQGGLATFTDALAEQVRGTVRAGAKVVEVRREGQQWRVALADGDHLVVDHVLFTTSGQVTASLLDDLAPRAAEALRQVTAASVATVVLGYEPAEVAGNRIVQEHNGVLVPSRHVRTMKAATNLSRKWPELGAEHHLWRASVGRSTNQLAVELSDDQLVARVASELGRIIGLNAHPRVSAMYRWPASMPQLTVGHLERMHTARDEVERLGGLHLAGSSVDGLGIGSTVKSGQQAARAIIDSLPTTKDTQ